MRAPVRIVRSAVPLGVPPETKKVREPAILSLQEGGRGESGRSQTLAVKPVSSLTGVAVKLQHSASNPRPWRHTGSPRIVGPGSRWNRILSSYAISGPNPRKNLPIARFFPQVDPVRPLHAQTCNGCQDQLEALTRSLLAESRGLEPDGAATTTTDPSSEQSPARADRDTDEDSTANDDRNLDAGLGILLRRVRSLAARFGVSVPRTTRVGLRPRGRGSGRAAAQAMRLPVQPERVGRVSRRRVVEGDGEILAGEGVRVDGQTQEAGVRLFVTFQDHALGGGLERHPRGDGVAGRVELELVHRLAVVGIAAGPRDDQGDLASVHRAGEALVVVDVTREDGVGPSPGKAAGALQGGEDGGRTAMVGVERVGRVVDGHDEALVGRRGPHLPLEPALLLVGPPTVEAAVDVRVEADDRRERGLEHPIDVRLRHRLPVRVEMLRLRVAEIVDETRQRGLVVRRVARAGLGVAVVVARDRKDGGRVILVRLVELDPVEVA